MDQKLKKQLWLETILKKLYKKVNSLQPVVKKKRTHVAVVNEKRPFVPVVNRKEITKRKIDDDSDRLPSSKKHKKSVKKNHEGPSEEEHIKPNAEKFWNFVDDFIHSRSFHARTKKGFFNSVNIPSTVNYAVWKNIEFLKNEVNSMDEENALALKIFFKIQKARMRRSAEVISREVLEEGSAT